VHRIQVGHIFNFVNEFPCRSVVEEKLLQILRDHFPDRCPRDSKKDFLSDAGLTPLQYARFIVAAEEAFRTTVSPDLSSGLDCVKSLACALTSGKLPAWGPAQHGALSPYPSPGIAPADDDELEGFIRALSRRLPLVTVHLTGERVIGTAGPDAGYELLVIVPEDTGNPKRIVADVLSEFRFAADIQIGYPGDGIAPSISMFPQRWVPRHGKEPITARRVLSHCIGFARCLDVEPSSVSNLHQLLAAIENPLTPAVSLLDFANWMIFPELAGQALTARALSGDPDAREICLL